jgi:DNA-binding MarR family transcriptional regulator
MQLYEHSKPVSKDQPVAKGPKVPVGCTNLKVKQASRLVARHYEAFVAPTGLRNTQYSLLSGVVKLGPLRSGELAAALKLDASTLSRNLQPLIDRGLVAVTTGADARSREVRATEAGVELRREAQKAWKRAQLALNERLGPERVAALHELLDDCMALLGADEGESDD